MIKATKLMRGVFLALAMMSGAAISGGSLVGIQPAQAQQAGETLISSVLFEGNSGFSDSQLLAMVDVAERGTVSQSRLAADVESIRLAYESKGYANVQVSVRQEPTVNGRVRVVFVIQENERTGIAAINFTGNNSIDAGTLKSVIQTRETHLLSWLFRDDAYDPTKLTIDQELIRLYYANRGYPDAVVTSAVAEYDASRNAYFINYTISEGERYQFGNIGIETSISGLNADALTGSIRTRSGSRYSFTDLQRTQEDLAFEATAQGYAFADVRPRIDRDIANNTFNVTYLVDEGPRLYVERINITGNDKTRDYVIRRELGFAEGDPFNRSMVQRGKTAVEELGFFQTVNVSMEPGSAPDRVIINLSVVEGPTGDYGASVGFSSTEGLLGEVSLTERNFLGRGQYLRAAVGITGSGRSFDFSFTEPRFMGLKISSGIDVYHRIQDETDSNYYGSTATGGQVRFGLPVTRDLTATLFTGVEVKNFVDENDNSSFVEDGDTRNKAWVGYTLSFNGLNDPKQPTEGLIASFTQQYIGLDYNLIKTEARARYYIPLMEDHGIIGSIKGQAGMINGLDGGVSSLEAFHHGPSLVRGLEARQFGPRLDTGEMLGTTVYVGGSAEVEFPLPVFPETYGLSGAVWADAAWIDGTAEVPGGTSIDGGSIDQKLKSSVGASVIWDSPFGPLRGDFAYVISKATEDRSQIFQLTIQNLL
ncbi:MAG TPA: outer membrane protein assembly factor BamA [Devosiaceae bacterium]|jgi:outer membrane protein insertion porin family|nr:outer membrane protein assembly factor BamA [Devosiaceae bacterium]